MKFYLYNGTKLASKFNFEMVINSLRIVVYNAKFYFENFCEINYNWILNSALLSKYSIKFINSYLLRVEGTT